MNKVKGAMTQAATYPTDVRAQMAAAYANEEVGDVARSLEYFDAAYVLGLPIDGRYRFWFAYAKALRRAGRVEDSEEILRIAIEEFPSDKAYPIFLALTLDHAGKSREAVAELLAILVRMRDVVVDMAEHKMEVVGYLKEHLGREVDAG